MVTAFYFWKKKIRGGAGDEAVQKEAWTSVVTAKNTINRSKTVHNLL
jgi:hypothetical protein